MEAEISESINWLWVAAEMVVSLLWQAPPFPRFHCPYLANGCSQSPYLGYSGKSGGIGVLQQTAL